MLLAQLSCSLRCSRRGAVAGTVSNAFLSRRSWAVDRSLVDDAQGRLVVDRQKAAAGLADPLAEPEGAFATIAAALAVAPSGATVVIRPGLYSEKIVVQRPVKMLADPGVTLVWKSDSPYEAALTVALEGGTPDSDARDASVLISGLRVSHYSPSIAQNYGVYVPQPLAAWDRCQIRLQECEITSNSGSGIGVEGGEVVVDSCRVVDCKNHGIVYVGSTARGSVQGSVAEKNKLNGLLLRDGASPSIANNTLRSNGRYGAELFDCRATLGPNYVAQNGKGSVKGECDDD